MQKRDEAFDIAKGVGIVAVVALHLSSRSATLFHKPYDGGWWTLKWINLFVNFCVPLFLLISAVLLARSAARQDKPDWKRFAWRRVRSVVLPLLVWSVVYWLLRAYVQHDPRMLKGGYWLDLKTRLADLIFGKAEFHLYFLSILAQVCLVLPLFFLLLKRLRAGIWGVLGIAILLQGLAFSFQKLAVHTLHLGNLPPFTYPGSTVFWYLSTIVPGIWVGMNWNKWPEIRGKTWFVWTIFAAAGFATFGYLSWEDLMKIKLTSVEGTIENAASSAYTLGMPFLILGLLTILRPAEGKAPLRSSLRGLGEMSLQIYLMHPILLQLFSKPTFLRIFKALPLPSLWIFLLTLFGTYGIGLLLNRVPYVNQIFFGKEKEQKPNEPTPDSSVRV